MIKITMYGSADQKTGSIEIDLQDSNIEHLICMGIRHGLFGAKADVDSSILNINDKLIDAIENK